ncbi:hypothetical protein [Hymenobacter convexus]|uniref:hypothetical protein n=1 Tax=Hymenobacter sp. CA1UV-4 TaxID=3063782 RepID=UPI002712A434|nr:hypothetical protein [Hymenobacter sp. CA1UV-4]MDO7853187.1 hypothetical protein [Hymenobacter sp. CA1UV-4]
MLTLLPLLSCLLNAPTQAPHPKAAPQPVGHRRIAPKPKATPVAYYCASGYTVKYHASPTCRGLENCSATIDKIALRTAQARMEPCWVCH